MLFGRTCLYRLNGEIRYLEENEEHIYHELKASGEWFNTPTEVKNYEEQIRQQPRKRERSSKRASATNGVRALSEEPVCEESPSRAIEEPRTCTGLES